MREDIYLKHQGGSLKIIYGPVSIPPHVIVSRSSLAEDIKRKIKHALLRLKDPSVLASINMSMEGFLPVSDHGIRNDAFPEVTPGRNSE